MFILMCVSLTMSMAMVMFTHPISMLVSIIIQTLMICLILWISIKSSWFSFILFLIFLGGLMILFVYIVSLASNEIFDMEGLSNKMYFLLPLILIILLPLKMFFFKSWESTENLLLNKILIVFSKNLILPTILVMTYLLMVLIITVKISSKIEGPIRSLTK